MSVVEFRPKDPTEYKWSPSAGDCFVTKDEIAILVDINWDKKRISDLYGFVRLYDGCLLTFDNQNMFTWAEILEARYTPGEQDQLTHGEVVLKL